MSPYPDPGGTAEEPPTATSSMRGPTTTVVGRSGSRSRNGNGRTRPPMPATMKKAAINAATKVSTSRSTSAEESAASPVVDPGQSTPLKQGHGPLAAIGADADDRV